MDILKPTYTKRLLFFLISDFIIFSVSLYAGLLFRFNFDVPQNYIYRWLYWFVIVDLIKISALWLSDIYKLNWRFVSINEFYKIVRTLLIVFVFVYFVNLGFQVFRFSYAMPRSAIIIDFFVSTFLVLTVRALRRVYLEIINPPKTVKTKRALIIGAGDSGERIARQLKGGGNEYEPIAFVDDDSSKIGTIIHNIKVVSALKDMDYVIKEYNIDSAIIAITTLHHTKVKELFDRLNGLGIRDIKIVPTIDKLPSNSVTVKDLKDISIEDILAREIARIDFDDIKSLIDGRVVMVTGAGGSIGSEITRQLMRFNPKSIIAFEIDETELHSLSLEFKSDIFLPVVGDIRDKAKLQYTINRYKPTVVFHAAAYKHVPMMEFFPEEAVKTNVFGTFNMVELSVQNGVERFINISTDKAVNPTSVMGATKRISEMICRSFDKASQTRFISVRFGNVLGSRGSAVPIFIEQIKNGGPVTVTHPEMRRYFMSIKEAVLLVFQAAAIGSGGEVFVLDMGEPIKIVELAERLIKLEGLKPYEDIEIKFIGIRPGEKLFEELLRAEEGTTQTKHSKIFIARLSNALSIDDIQNHIEQFRSIIDTKQFDRIPLKLREIVPFFSSK